MTICDVCRREANKQPALTIHDDDEFEDPYCDTCGSMAAEWPELGWVCVRTQKLLVEVGEDGLYHPEMVSFYKRLKFALFK